MTLKNWCAMLNGSFFASMAVVAVAYLVGMPLDKAIACGVIGLCAGMIIGPIVISEMGVNTECSNRSTSDISNVMKDD